jgi:hypothetical protein
MTLTPEQTQAVASWIAAGDNLSVVQQKLRDQFQISLTYRDVRFLVDDLNLALKDPAPKVDTTDVSKAAPAKAASGPGQPPRSGNPAEPGPDIEGELLEDTPAPGAGAVTVEVDKVTLLPGALASGSVTFSDGVSGKWVVDQQGRPGFTEISQPGYRPTPADGQAFMQELSAQLQRRGF